MNDLVILRTIIETQNVDSEKSLETYKALINNTFLNIKEKVEALSQETDQNIAKLVSMLAKAFFQHSDPFFEMTDKIRKFAHLELYNYSLSLDFELLSDVLSSLIATEELPQPIRDQLADIYEKLNSSNSSAKFVVFSLNEAFNAVPNELTEIVCSRKDVIERIDDLKKCLGEKKLLMPFDYYLSTFQDYFSLFIRLEGDNRTIEADIKRQLEMFEAQYDKCKDVKLLASEYRDKLKDLIAMFNDETLIEHPSKLNKQLVELKNELQQGSLFEKVKQKKLASLNKLQEKVSSILQSDASILRSISDAINNASVSIDRLITEHQAKKSEIGACLKKYINDCEKLNNLSEIESFTDVAKELGRSYEPLRNEIDAYSLAATILFSDAYAIPKFFESKINDPVERTALIKRLGDKIFCLLGELSGNQFGKFVENLLKMLEEVPPLCLDASSLLRREFREFVIQEKQLEYFIGQHAENVCEYLCQLSRGVRTKDKEFYIRLNGYLHMMKIDQLQAIAEKRSDLRQTIRRVISTKQLLELQYERCGDSGSFWETCVLFYEFNTGERPLPLFTTPENRDWFNSVKEVINTLMQQVSLVDKKKTNYTSSFFLCGDAKSKKRQALDKLKEQLEALPSLGNRQVLDEKLKGWENKFGSTIDQPRYRFYLVILMKLYHIFKHLMGQMVETESRYYVELLKESLYKASATMQTDFQEGTASQTFHPYRST